MNRMVMNSLEDWCEQMLECCKAKSIHEHEPIMASIANDEDCGDFIDDKSFKGASCKYKLTDSNLVGENVTLSEMVGYSYTLCAIIYSSYKRLCQDIEEVIMNRIDDQEERVDDGYDCVDGHQTATMIIPDVEAYLRWLYLCLKSQGMVSANECMLSGYFGCRQQCLYGCLCFCLLIFALLGYASEYATQKPIVNCTFDIVNTK